MELFQEIKSLIQDGHARKAVEAVRLALEQGLPAADILNRAMVPAMYEVGIQFKKSEIYIPEVLIASRAMDMAMNELNPYLGVSDVERMGSVVIGTVQGDMHDIGKNLVKMMLTGQGLRVWDLGINVPAREFLRAAREHDADIICCSALLTTTLCELRRVIACLREEGCREDYVVMIGGAPTSQSFCDAIGADYYTPDATSAALLASRICQERRHKRISGEKPL